MKIQKNTLLRLIYEPKKVLLLPTVIIIAAIILFVGVLTWIKINGHRNQQAFTEFNEQGTGYNQTIASMQAHIASLNSRIQHLSTDNKRLSSTGQKLSAQLRQTSSSIKEQLAHTKELQLELYTLDQHLISKYDNFIELQKQFNEAKLDCDKEKGKDKAKSKACMNFKQVRQDVEDLISQIKFLKAKREVLLSEIDRTAA
jgi:chromosome segregation ATPase